MRRIKDYASFGLWFLGLGYIVMWVLTGPLNWPFGTSGNGLCGSADSALLCALAHPQALSPFLHMIGLFAAIIVIVRLLLTAVRSARRPSPDFEAGVERPVRRRRPPMPTAKRVKSRDYFGLRGIEH